VLASRHTMHSYYVCNPESPNGRRVLYYASSAANGYVGDLCTLERRTGRETVLARNVHVEDAHRAACQQWISGGRRVAFHEPSCGVRCLVTALDSGLHRCGRLGSGDRTRHGRIRGGWCVGRTRRRRGRPVVSSKVMVPAGDGRCPHHARVERARLYWGCPVSCFSGVFWSAAPCRRFGSIATKDRRFVFGCLAASPEPNSP